MLNLSPLFHTTDENYSCFICEIDLSPAERSSINAAKTEIRQRLRTGIPKVLIENEYQGTVPTPKFFTQGSWAYKTINAPARPSVQQADIDDGCYLPMSFVTQTQKPSHASKIFFLAAEACLATLCLEKGWELCTDKPTCIRVIISKTAHIDIPLYAIPDDEYAAMSKSIMESYGYESFAAALNSRSSDSWTALPSDKVMLAHRIDNWVASDPRPVKEWFLEQVQINGEQLRRVVRYLKAFRDWRWHSGGPSSILLMVAAASVFKASHRRDDIALLGVLDEIPAKLLGGINNPTDAGESLTKRLGQAGVQEAAEAFQEFAQTLRAAIAASNASQVCQWMRGEFGPRFPAESDRIQVVSVLDTITSTPPSRGDKVLPLSTKSAG